mmetsp:Transcript_23860/g.49655  ORF Transcript_23860/g.49655 Transcript_23860/m.49655 type:complete len:274 (+) Transcript_23860:277-1098(+)
MKEPRTRRATGTRPMYHSSQSECPEMMGATVRLTIDMSLIRMLRAGPEVSLNGSPTVSPTTQALWVSVPLPPQAPSISMYFLELSQAPPALLIMMAIIMPEAIAPPSMPTRHLGPTRKPMTRGERTAQRPGRIISSTELWVEMATHLSESASALPSMRPGISANWRRTSMMMAPAAFWTESMVRAAKRKGSMAPKRAPERTMGSEMSAAETPADSLKAESREREVRTADPMANPFPVAAVVFPRASRASVVSRTRSSRSAISAMPPALSATGP